MVGAPVDREEKAQASSQPFTQPAELSATRLATLRRALPGDIQAVLDEFREAGWVVARISGSSHPALVAPDGVHTTLSTTPSDRNAATKARAELKRWQRNAASRTIPRESDDPRP